MRLGRTSLLSLALLSLVAGGCRSHPDLNEQIFAAALRRAPDHPVGIALCVGLDCVDLNHYAGWTGNLATSENDARDMAKICAGEGLDVITLLTAQATREALLETLNKLSGLLRSGDLLVVTFSGHGGQLEDEDGDENDHTSSTCDSWDETWCLYNGQVVDDELHDAWTRLECGVRVLVVVDCCYGSGGIGLFARKPIPRNARAIPIRQAGEAEARSKPRRQSRPRDPITATVLTLAACGENAVATSASDNGLFTCALKQVWSDGFSGGHKALREEIEPRTRGQLPVFKQEGKERVEFVKQRPFTRARPLRR